MQQSQPKPTYARTSPPQRSHPYARPPQWYPPPPPTPPEHYLAAYYADPETELESQRWYSQRHPRAYPYPHMDPEQPYPSRTSTPRYPRSVPDPLYPPATPVQRYPPAEPETLQLYPLPSRSHRYTRSDPDIQRYPSVAANPAFFPDPYPESEHPQPYPPRSPAQRYPDTEPHQVPLPATPATPYPPGLEQESEYTLPAPAESYPNPHSGTEAEPAPELEPEPRHPPALIPAQHPLNRQPEPPQIQEVYAPQARVYPQSTQDSRRYTQRAVEPQRYPRRSESQTRALPQPEREQHYVSPTNTAGTAGSIGTAITTDGTLVMPPRPSDVDEYEHQLRQLNLELQLVPIPSAVSSTTTVNECNDADGRHRWSRASAQDAWNELFPGPAEKKKHPFLVEFAPGDPLNPMNWSRAYRWFLTIFSGILVFNASFASSAPSGIVTDLIEHFSFSEEVADLTITLFVFGYCLGPLVWGPLSEEFGRKPVFIASFLFYTGFQAGCALSQNTASILVFRILAGTFAAAPLTNSGALISDIWDAATRGKALAVFTMAPFAGPALGPLVGGYISTAGVDWRWLFWVLTMFTGACLVLTFFFVPETYAPIIIVQKAKKLRKDSGDDRYYAPLEQKEKQGFASVLEKTLARPFKMLIQEPMLLAITVYMSFVYGCVYLLFEALPIVFTEGHHFSAGGTGLTFLPIFIGVSLGSMLYLSVFNPRYERFIKEFAPDPVPPEKRLEIAFVGAPIFAISFFWFGWTSFPSISYWVPMLAGGGLGLGTVLIFLPFINYIIDSYLFVAASALAANTVARSIFGAVFPLFTTQMYDAMDPRWASTLVGFVAVAMLPIPLLLYKFGPTLRRKSKHAQSRVPTQQAPAPPSLEKPTDITKPV